MTLLAVFSVVILCLALRPREPAYQGKGLSVWLRELDTWPGKSSEPATKAIREIGTNALPYLIPALQAEDSALKVKLAKLLGRQNLIRFRFRFADENSDTAYKALILGSTASNAIPEIVRMLNQQNMTGSAGMALFAIGGISIPTLVEACHHTNPSVRTEAAFILCKLTPTGRRGYSTTYYPSGSTNPVSRFVMTIGDDDMAALAANLNDSRAAVRRASAEALLRHSGVAKPALPGLLKALEDPDLDVRKAAAEALKTIDPETASQASVK